jgi:hypothetical protein
MPRGMANESRKKQRAAKGDNRASYWPAIYAPRTLGYDWNTRKAPHGIGLV